jgi:hypothetical protein
MNESNNLYVSSRGILKSCDYHSITPHSSIRQLINYLDVEIINTTSNPTVYICSSAIPHFIANMLSLITTPFILVSGDCDETIPHDIMSNEEFDAFINHNLLLHWFCQNIVVRHDKITCMPIGLDYHTMQSNEVWGGITSASGQEAILESVKQNSLHFTNRLIKCYANYQFLVATKYGRYDRQDAYDNICKELVYYEPNKINRLDTWTKQADYAFVISPHGNGYDCHRTWEALILGCIPIVKKSAIDILYEDLPVLIVNEWRDVTAELLHDTVERYKNRVFNFDKLRLKYWTDMFSSRGLIRELSIEDMKKQ